MSQSASVRRLTVGAGSVLAGLLGIPPIVVTPGGGARPPQVPIYVFPVPDAHFASPETQIVFRGLSAGELSTISATGSVSGAHPGRVFADSDNGGGSFVPTRPFSPGERVTVTTRLNVVGGTNGTFRFSVATPAGEIRPQFHPPAPRVRGDVWRFRTRRDFAPASVRVDRRSGQSARGYIFITPQAGPIQKGPMILDSRGRLVWFKPLPHGTRATDAKVQRYRGRPVLTWWQGYAGSGVGVGEDVIVDSSYRQIAIVHAGNGQHADLHDFQLTSRGTALMTAFFPVWVDASSVHGARRQIVLDSLVQEIDIPTGLVMFEWDSLDHIPLSDTYWKVAGDRTPFDYFHVNSIDVDRDGNLVLSARNTWAAYKVNRHTGSVIWTLGGKRSSFRMRRGAQFAYQHDVRVRSSGDRVITAFDDGATPQVHRQSRGLTLKLSFRHKTATRVREVDHRPLVVACCAGNLQQLANGHQFVGWGAAPYISEFNGRGRLIFDAHFLSTNWTFRAWRFPWRAAPDTLPNVAAVRRGRRTTVYVSWNGATEVGSWRVLAGRSPTSLRTVKRAPKRGFETSIRIGSARYVAVQAIDRHGHLLGRQSLPVRG